MKESNKDVYKIIRKSDVIKTKIINQDGKYNLIFSGQEKDYKNDKMIGICYPNIKPSKIYLGYNITEENKLKVSNLCKYKNIEVYETYHDFKDPKVKMNFKKLQHIKYLSN